MFIVTNVTTLFGRLLETVIPKSIDVVQLFVNIY